jgi:FkbM family methyltransferase
MNSNVKTDLPFPYVAKDRIFLDERFDFLIVDETARSWYDGSPQQMMPEREWCRRHILPGNTVVDCGAHHGMMSVLFSRWTGVSGKVIACEPIGANARVVEQNAALNGIQNITVRPVGVGSRASVLLAALNAGNAMVGHSTAQTPVTIVRLDDDLPPEMVVNFLKIDVEGSDLEALEGARRILSQRPIVDLEIHNFLFAKPTEALGKIFSFFPADQWRLEVLPEIFSETRPVDGPVDTGWLSTFANPHVFCVPHSTDS